MNKSEPDRWLSPGGHFGWHAYPPGEAPPDRGWEPPRDGSIIRFMADDGVEVPLWGEFGLHFSDSDELVLQWRLSEELANDVVAWGRASQSKQDDDLDAEAVRLVRRLSQEMNDRFTFVYHP